jgi:hypothetical protein
MRQVAPERLLIVEIHDDREIPVALRQPEIRTERQAANLWDRSLVAGEMLHERVYGGLLRAVLPGQDVHMPEREQILKDRCVADRSLREHSGILAQALVLTPEGR